MNVRPFDWRDIPALSRWQHESIILDSALALTRGPLLLPGALVSFLAPAIGLFTNVVETGDEKDASLLIGQSIHVSGSPTAHLTFMTPGAAVSQPSVAALSEALVAIAGERGALRLLADVDEETDAYEMLRQSGFATYARQRVWRVGKLPGSADPGSAWRNARSQDAIAIRSLYNNLAPGLVQQIEPLVAKRPGGLVYVQGGELRAYVEFKSGPRGVWMQPFIHPDAENASEWLAELLAKMMRRTSRPLYVCVRSYQSWLEGALEDLGAAPAGRQAVMAKHLTIHQKAARPLAIPALEGGQAEISAPIARAGTIGPEEQGTLKQGNNLWNK